VRAQGKEVGVKLSEKIRKLRKGKKLSQVELAAQAGINSNHLSRLERGIFQPSSDVLKRLAQALDVSVDHLLSDEDMEATEVRIENRSLTERVKLIEQLQPDDQEAVMRVIDSMLTKERMRRLLDEQAAAGS
jgi:transcriptional regulator with XRE-family HTH domain